MASVDELVGRHIPPQQAEVLGLVLATPAGAGTTFATGTALARNSLNTVSSLTAASLEAFAFPAAVPGDIIALQNVHASAAAKLFPPAGGKLGGSAVDAVFSVAAGRAVICMATSTINWLVCYGA